MNKLIDSAGLIQIRDWVNNKLTYKIGVLDLGPVSPGSIPINELFSRMLEFFGNLTENTGGYSTAGIVTCSGYLNFYGFVAIRYAGAFETTAFDLKAGKFFYDFRYDGESFVSMVNNEAKRLVTEDILADYIKVTDLTNAEITSVPASSLLEEQNEEEEGDKE